MASLTKVQRPRAAASTSRSRSSATCTPSPIIWTVTRGSASAVPAKPGARAEIGGIRVEDVGDGLPARLESAPRLASVGIAVAEGDHDPTPPAFRHEIEGTGQLGGKGDHRDRTCVAQ